MKRMMTVVLALVLAGVLTAATVVQWGCSAADNNVYKVHDIRDLLVTPPGFQQAPDFSVSSGGRRAPEIPGLATDELWVIEKRPENSADRTKDDMPGSGALMARPMSEAGTTAQPDMAPLEKKLVPVPLQHTDVRASVAGYIAAVDVTQQYANPFAEKIEATYVFPLPHNAAVNEFVMVIGDRRIRGIIREREEAKRIYQEARSQGFVASLLTQERPNIFTQTVGNIEPGKRIDIQIRYYHTLSAVDGWYEFVFPMVVGPRFNPPGFAGGIGAIPRNQAIRSGQSTDVQYLRPTERSGHDISVSVDVDSPIALEELVCRTHQVTISKKTEGHAIVSINDADRIPNKDFVLRYRLAGQQIKSGAIACRTERGGYYTVMIVPPESMRELRRKPIEMFFTLDVSGSMSGRPFDQARDAVRQALQQLQPGDTFNVIRFANYADAMSSRPVEVTPQNIDKAMGYLQMIEAGGGTMMMEGIRKSLLWEHDPSRLRFVAFLTDGYIGNEVEILGEIDRDLGPARIFSFGVGTSVNRYLLEHMAKTGRGCAAFLGHSESGKEVMSAFFERISHPAMTDVSVDVGGAVASDVYPRRIPDLFCGRPVILTGRCNGELPTVIRVRGRIGDQTQEFTVPIVAAESMAAKALPSLWARSRIADIGEAMACGRGGGIDEIKSVALEYSLMSPFTAFVAVDASRRTEGAHGTSVGVPVPMPEGVKYETTVPEK